MTQKREIQIFSNISADTAAFTLSGGLYGIDVMGSSFGTVTLQKLAGDNSTYVTAVTAWSANLYQTAQLASGTYKFAISSTTGVYINLTSILVPML